MAQEYSWMVPIPPESVFSVFRVSITGVVHVFLGRMWEELRVFILEVVKPHQDEAARKDAN